LFRGARHYSFLATDHRSLGGRLATSRLTLGSRLATLGFRRALDELPLGILITAALGAEVLGPRYPLPFRAALTLGALPVFQYHWLSFSVSVNLFGPRNALTSGFPCRDSPSTSRICAPPVHS